jgi:hypothetical protein
MISDTNTIPILTFLKSLFPEITLLIMYKIPKLKIVLGIEYDIRSSIFFFESFSIIKQLLFVLNP